MEIYIDFPDKRIQIPRLLCPGYRQRSINNVPLVDCSGCFNMFYQEPEFNDKKLTYINVVENVNDFSITYQFRLCEDCIERLNDSENLSKCMNCASNLWEKRDLSESEGFSISLIKQCGLCDQRVSIYDWTEYHKLKKELNVYLSQASVSRPLMEAKPG